MPEPTGAPDFRKAPGPPAPPLVPGHLGNPSWEVVSSAKAVLGALMCIEEDGLDVAGLRIEAKRALDRLGLRERDLVAPENSVEVAEDRIRDLSEAQLAEISCRRGAPYLDAYLALQEKARRAA